MHRMPHPAGPQKPAYEAREAARGPAGLRHTPPACDALRRALWRVCACIHATEAGQAMRHWHGSIESSGHPENDRLPSAVQLNQ